MEKRLLLLLTFSALIVLSQGTWLSIDCGSTFGYRTLNGIYWQTDQAFINTGENRQVSGTSNTNLDLLNSLRVFKKQNKNCYTLATGDITRYFIRTTFHYGNYDERSSPPTFDIEIDGNKWVTVVSSLVEPVYYEVIYPSKGESISVCLARTRPNQWPFISSLEVWNVPDTMYVRMSWALAWLNNYRSNYGAKDYILGYDADRYNRIWKPAYSPGLLNVSADTLTVYYTTYEFPPHSAIFDAVEAPNPTDSISLTFPLAKTNSLNYVEAYFTEMTELELNQTRKFSFWVNNEHNLTISPQYQNITAAVARVQSVGTTLTVAIRPTADSTLAPIVSAIEVYTAGDPLVTTGTSPDDLDGLAVFTSTFEQLQGWSGEPCLPSDTIWQWLGCNGTDPPRVTSLYLSGYGLKGPLPEFSQMQALESIDLSNNNLNGAIPEFLGNLPNLNLLNLAGNDFSGDVPRSITDNKKIKLYIHGSPSLHHQKAKQTAMLIGLAVGIPLGVVLIVVALVCFLRQKKPKPEDQAQATTTSELVAPQVDGTADPGKPLEKSVSISISTGPTPLPITQHEEENNEITNEISAATFDRDLPLSANAGSFDEASGVPDVDMEELDDLLQHHENAKSIGRT